MNQRTYPFQKILVTSETITKINRLTAIERLQSQFRHASDVSTWPEQMQVDTWAMSPCLFGSKSHRRIIVRLQPSA